MVRVGVKKRAGLGLGLSDENRAAEQEANSATPFLSHLRDDKKQRPDDPGRC